MTSIKSIIDKNLVCVFALASESSLAWDLFNSHQNSGSRQGVPVFLCYQLQHAIEISQVFPQLSNNLSSSLLLENSALLLAATVQCFEFSVAGQCLGNGNPTVTIRPFVFKPFARFRKTVDFESKFLTRNLQLGMFQRNQIICAPCLVNIFMWHVTCDSIMGCSQIVLIVCVIFRVGPVLSSGPRPPSRRLENAGTQMEHRPFLRRLQLVHFLHYDCQLVLSTTSFIKGPVSFKQWELNLCKMCKKCAWIQFPLNPPNSTVSIGEVDHLSCCDVSAVFVINLI